MQVREKVANSRNTAFFFPECVARIPVSLWGSGVEGVIARRCPTVRNRPQPSATVRNRPQPSATVRNRPQLSATVRNRPRDPHMAVPMALWQVLQKGSLLEVSQMALLRYAWQAWHFVTFRRVL